MEDSVKFLVEMGEAVFSELEQVAEIEYLSGSTFRLTLVSGRQYTVTLSAADGCNSLKEFGKARRLHFKGKESEVI